MRVAVVAGPDPGHAFPALALCRLFLAAGDSPTLLTGTEWLDTARSVGVDAVELVGLDPTELDDDTDAGADVHQCRTGDASSGFSSDLCPRDGGLDQNIYGDKTP